MAAKIRTEARLLAGDAATGANLETGDSFEKILEPSAVDVQAPAADDKKRIATIKDEIEAFFIIKSILRRKVAALSISFKDTISNFAILLDGSSRNSICRLWLNSEKKKYISLFDEQKIETKVEIGGIDDLYNFEEQLIKTIDFFTK